jgi:hypothetical protein
MGAARGPGRLCVTVQLAVEYWLSLLFAVVLLW